MAFGAYAQGALEIISLRHRTAEQVLPVLRPLVEPGGVLSGQGNQLFVRVSERNLGEIRAALAAIDTPARQLLISVRYGGAADRARAGSAGEVDLRPGGSRAEVRIGAAGESSNEAIDQRIRVLEGARAFIAAGRSGAFREASTGFEVVPRLAGGTVFVELVQQRETPGALPGSVRSQRVATTVSGVLGQWIEIGGAGASVERDERGIAGARSARLAGEERVWIKVEEAGR